MSKRRTVQIVNFENYARKLKPTAPLSEPSKERHRLSVKEQPRLPLLSPLLAKCERLQALNGRLATAIEELVDDMLDEVEGRRP